MNNLIIPAAGKSSRFPNMKPKWMLTHPDGQLMIEKALSPIKLTNYDNVVITILREHCEKYEADLILKQIFGDKVIVCILENVTNSSVETVIATINRLNLTGFVTVKDSDCYVECEYPLNKQFVVGMKINSNSKVDKVQNKSFILKNEDDLVLDIVEKKIISDIICIGVYGFEIKNLVDSYYLIINNPIYKFNNELYLSHIISYLIINHKQTFEFVQVNSFIDWGTIDEWKKEQNKYKTYFFDIDGVILKNTGKWGSKNWYDSFEPIEENVELLKQLSDRGSEIIFVTARDENSLKQFKNYMQQKNIKYKTIITSCLHSKRIIVNDFSYTNSFPSCDAISIPRDSQLRAYINEDL